MASIDAGKASATMVTNDHVDVRIAFSSVIEPSFQVNLIPDAAGFTSTVVSTRPSGRSRPLPDGIGRMILTLVGLRNTSSGDENDARSHTEVDADFR